MLPTFEHEAWRDLMRTAAPEVLEHLLAAAGARIPAITSLREASQNATQLVPVQFVADAVLLSGEPTSHVLLIEVQRHSDERKRLSWPMYVASLHAEHQCPVTLLVVCPTARVARWARRPIGFGTGATLVPTVLGPDAVPLADGSHLGEHNLTLAVLGAAMHARDPAALQRAKALGAEVLNAGAGSHNVCYHLLETLFGSAFSNHMEALMDAHSWYDRSPMFRKVKEIATAEGLAEGKAEGVIAVLRARSLSVSTQARARIEACKDLGLLETWLTRAVTAAAADDIF